MGIKEEIAELEKKAIKGEIALEKYETLKCEVSKVIAELQLLMGETIKVRLINSQSRPKKNIPPIVDEIYEDMRTDDSKQWGTPEISKVIVKHGMEPHSPYVVAVKRALLERPGVKERKDGNSKVLFYHRTTTEAEKEELINSLNKKFNKMG